MGDQPGRGPLAVLLDDVAAGWFPPADGGVTFVPPPAPRDAGVIGFTAHAVIFTDADPAWVTAQLLGRLLALARDAGVRTLADLAGVEARKSAKRKRKRSAMPTQPLGDSWPGYDA